VLSGEQMDLGGVVKKRQPARVLDHHIPQAIGCAGQS
jgi:hypothetical protein